MDKLIYQNILYSLNMYNKLFKKLVKCSMIGFDFSLYALVILDLTIGNCF